MCGMWPWKVPKWLWIWSEVVVKAWRVLATLLHCRASFRTESGYEKIDCLGCLMAASNISSGSPDRGSESEKGKQNLIFTDF
jgi:hypothetical protein